MRKILILFVLISFCGGSSEITSVEDITTTSSSSTSTSSTTTLQESDTPFNTYWRDNKLKSYRQLTEEEIQISNTINQNKISYLVLADGTECVKKIGGTSTVARIDEFDLVNPKGSNEWGFIVSEEYTCDDEKRPGRLYGDFFFQDNTWWAYVEINSDEIDIASEWDVADLNVWKFATRTEIAADTFSGNYTCRADADFIERAYEKMKIDEYSLFKDREVDYSKPTTLEELEESISLLEKAQDYYSIALSVRLGYNFGDIEDLDPENSFIDAVLYGMIVNTKDNLASKYARRDYVIENGPFETNAEVTEWWMANSSYSAVEWRTTDEYIEFYLGKMEEGGNYGNHIVEDYVAPNPDWVISEEYPRDTLRKKCEND